MDEPQMNKKPESPFAQGYHTPYQSPYQPRPKEYYPLRKRDSVFALLALVLSLIGVSLSLWGQFMIGYTVSYVLFFALTTAYLADRQTHLRVFPLLCALLVLAGSAVFAVSDCPDVNFLLVLMMFALSAVWFRSLRERTDPRSDLGLIASLFTSTFGKTFHGLPTAMRSLFQKKNGKLAGLGKVLAGAACAVPVLIVVVPLLISSDAAFEGLISDILDDLRETSIKALAGTVFGALLISYAYALKMGKPARERKSSFAGIESVFVASFLGMIGVCYLAYLFSQLAYFFNGFAGILPEQFNAADYARRGFFELCAIAVINLMLLFGTLALSRKKDGKPSCIVRLLSVFIILFTLVIVATALSKMAMYINRFGMTRLRVSTSAFMVFLGIIFLALLVKYFLPGTPVVKVSMVTGACVLLLLGFGNVDRVVAEYNIEAYRSGALPTLDVDTIGELGTAAVPYLIELTQDENEKIANAARQKVLDKIFRLYTVRGNQIVRQETELGQWNLSRSRAYRMLDAYIPEDAMPLVLEHYGYDPAQIQGKDSRHIMRVYGEFDEISADYGVLRSCTAGYLLEMDWEYETYLQIRFDENGIACDLELVTK